MSEKGGAVPRWDFDGRAKTWDSDPQKIARARDTAEVIRRMVPLSTEMRALEYGCGTGLLSFALRPHVRRITMADSSDGMLEVLRGKVEAHGDGGMLPLKFDAVTDPLPEDRYDLICTQMTLHHILETERVLRAFHSLLEAPGFLCVADLEREDGSFHGSGFVGHNGFDREELAMTARRAGFADVRFTSAFEMDKEVNGTIRRFPLFLMVAEKR